MQVRVQDHGVHSQITTMVSRLALPNCTCLHRNTVRVVQLQDQLEVEEPEVVSSHVQQQHNCIIRTTHLRHLRKKYIIEDVYQFDYSPGLEHTAEPASPSFQSSYDKISQEDDSPAREKQKHSNRLKKVCIFQKSIENGKRNTKNLPKNFYKGFLAFIQSRTKDQNLEDVLRFLVGLGKGAKYNNILIQKLLSHPRIAPFFRDFLENHAEKWIVGSKITDKGMHLEAVPIYLSLFSKYSYAEGDASSQS